MEGVNSSMIYLKNICKCHNVLPHSTIKKKKMVGKYKYNLNVLSFPCHSCYKRKWDGLLVQEPLLDMYI
jgi:hypothetical protein